MKRAKVARFHLEIFILFFIDFLFEVLNLNERLKYCPALLSPNEKLTLMEN